ncbi:MAG: polysaccharide deacetylase family protein [Pirellulaceae bacterium]
MSCFEQRCTLLRLRCGWISLALAVTCSCNPLVMGQDAEQMIRLIVRSDDMGAAHAVNVACLRTVTHGIARSIEVIVPAPWFIEAVEMLKQHPDIDVGVHLDLTSEWSRVKWGPVCKSVPSLVDANGHFYPMTRQQRGWPPNTGFLDSDWKIDQVERELRAQIETAKRLLPNVTHLSAHMGTATSSPELRTLTQRLAAEYDLPLSLPNIKATERFGGPQTTPEEKETQMIQILENLSPGLWMFVEHPALDTPEMRALGHRGYDNVASDRAGVTRAFTSGKAKEVIERRSIQLVSYADVLRAMK